MNRSPGVTAVAVVAMLEGLLACSIGAFAVLGLAMSRAVPQPTDSPKQPVAVGAILLLEVVMFLGVGGWKIASAVGLLRQKNWARISLCAWGGVFAVFNLFGLLGALLMAKISLPMTAANVPPDFMTVFAWVMGMLCLIQAGIGVWWLVFLNRRAVMLAYSIVCAGIEIGLLLRNALSLRLALGSSVFTLLNALITLLVPGALHRHQEIIARTMPSQQQAWMAGLMPHSLWFGLAFGLLYNGGLLWFLITSKSAYLAAARGVPSNPQAA
jgi:hypothetical protein